RLGLDSADGPHRVTEDEAVVVGRSRPVDERLEVHLPLHHVLVADQLRGSSVRMVEQLHVSPERQVIQSPVDLDVPRAELEEAAVLEDDHEPHTQRQTQAHWQLVSKLMLRVPDAKETESTRTKGVAIGCSLSPVDETLTAVTSPAGRPVSLFQSMSGVFVTTCVAPW